MLPHPILSEYEQNKADNPSYLQCMPQSDSNGVKNEAQLFNQSAETFIQWLLDHNPRNKAILNLLDTASKVINVRFAPSISHDFDLHSRLSAKRIPPHSHKDLGTGLSATRS